MVRWLSQILDCRVFILDNASTAPDLLAWYDEIAANKPIGLEVVRLKDNLGKFAPWKSGLVDSLPGEFYVVTDPDLDLSGIPLDVLDVLKAGMLKHNASKAGLSLRLDDLPEDSLVGQEAAHWEAQWWKDKADDQFFNAAIDTTFAMYRKSKTDGGHIRSAPPYMARHLPWYLNESNMTEEYRYYLSTASSVSDWGNKMKRVHRDRTEPLKGRYVTFTFDDGDVQTAMQANQIMEPDHATFYLVTGWLDGSVPITDAYNVGVNHGTDRDWRALAYWGHDIGSHSHGHGLPPEESRIDGYQRSLNYIKRFGVGPFSLSMPYHAKGAVAAPYDSIRCGNSIRFNPLNWPLREVGSWTIYPEKFDEIVKQLRDVNPADCWTVFCLHGLDGRLCVPSWARNDFMRLLDTVRVLGYKVRSMAEMAVARQKARS